MLSEMDKVTTVKVYNWFANRRKDDKRRRHIGKLFILPNLIRSFDQEVILKRKYNFCNISSDNFNHFLPVCLDAKKKTKQILVFRKQCFFLLESMMFALYFLL